MGDVGADCFGNFFECASISAVDAEKVADTVIGHVGHIRQAAFHATIMPVIHEAIFNAPVIAQPVAGLQCLLCGPGASRNLHAINIRRGDDLRARGGSSI